MVSVFRIHASNIIKLTNLGLLYTYLADCVGKREKGGAFRSLQRGFIHWSSGRLSKLEMNFCHPLFCHVRCQTTPSMKQGLYHLYVLLGREGQVATIINAIYLWMCCWVSLTFYHNHAGSIIPNFIIVGNQLRVLMCLLCYMLLRPLLHMYILDAILMHHQMKKQLYLSLRFYASGMHHVSVIKKVTYLYQKQFSKSMFMEGKGNMR